MELQIIRDDEPAPPGLSLIDALDEMIAWLRDERDFVARHHGEAWRSAAEDLRRAVEWSGKSVRRHVVERLDHFDVDDAIERAKAGCEHSADLDLLESVRETVVSDEGVRALWSDLVDAARSLSWSLVDRFRHGLVRVEAVRGNEVRDRFRVLAGVLRGDVRDVGEAQNLLDETSSPDAAEFPEPVGAEAGLGEDDRVALAARYLCASYRDSRFVVWLAVDRATMSRGVMPVGSGSVTFFDSRLIAEVLKSAPEDRREHLPDEIRSARAWATFLPEGEFTLLARIDMGVRSASFVARDARLRLLTLLAPAPRFYPADWNVLPGSVVFRDGEDVGYSAFEDVAQIGTSHRLDGVADSWLEGRAGDLESHLVSPEDPQLLGLLKLVEWDAAHRDGDDLTRTLLAVRTVETIAAAHVGGFSWQKMLATYRSVFVWSRLKNDLSSKAGAVLYCYDRHPREEARERLREVFLEVVRSDRSAVITRLDRLLRFIPELCEIWDIDWEWTSGVVVERAVRLEELHAINKLWTDAELFSQRMTKIESDLELQLRRLARVRNAAQHGGPILDESVRSVVGAADHWRSQIIADMVDGLIQGRSCRSTLDVVERYGEQRADVLAETGSPLSALAVPVDFT